MMFLTRPLKYTLFKASEKTAIFIDRFISTDSDANLSQRAIEVGEEQVVIPQNLKDLS